MEYCRKVEVHQLFSGSFGKLKMCCYKEGKSGRDEDEK